MRVKQLLEVIRFSLLCSLFILSATAGAQTTIDVLVTYNGDVTQAKQGRDIEARVASYIDYSNQAYSNSNTNAVLRLVGLERLDRYRNVNSQNLESFRADGDVARLRSQYGADLVTHINLATSLSGGFICGIGYVPSGRNGRLSSNARNYSFSLVAVDCGLSTFPHELGHNMGLGHSERQGDTGGVFRWGRGYGVDGLFSTIMAYPQSFGTRNQLPYMSNPNILGCEGLSCGVEHTRSDGADAARNIRDLAQQLASFANTVIPVDPIDPPPPPSAPLIPQNTWQLLWASSEETINEDGAANNAFDGRIDTSWHSMWSSNNLNHPHEIQIDLGLQFELVGLQYSPRPNTESGRIAAYDLYVSQDGTNWGAAISTGSFANLSSSQEAFFPAQPARFVRFRSLSEVNGNPWASIAEINFRGQEIEEVCLPIEFTISPSEALVVLGDELALVAEALDSCGETTIVEVDWSANAPGGLFRATQIGEHTVTAEYEGLTANVQIIVDSNGEPLDEQILYTSLSKGGRGIAACTGANRCAENTDWVDIGADSGYEWLVDGGDTGGKVNLGFGISVPGGFRSMSVWVNGVYRATFSANFFQHGRPNPSTFWIGDVLLTKNINTIEFRDTEGRAEFDVHYLHVNIISTDVDTVPPAIISIPGRLEVEDYKADAYYDNTLGNTGGEYRNDDVDIEIAQDTGGGFSVGWVDVGEWLSYDIAVQSTGNYNFILRMASGWDGEKSALIKIDDMPIGTFTLTDIAGWQSWRDVSISNVPLFEGTHTLKIEMQDFYFNLNYLDIYPSP